MSRARLASIADVSQSHLRNIENDHRVAKPDHVARIDRALGAHGLLVDLANAEEDTMRRRAVLQGIALIIAPNTPDTPRRAVGEPELAALRERLHTYRRLDNAHGGAAVRDIVAHTFTTEALPMIRHSATGAIEAALQTLTAEFAQLAGWTAYDSGLHSTARTYFNQAYRLATAAGDDALAGEVLAAMSHQAAFLGNGPEAVELADAALKNAVRSGLPALTAEAHMSAAHGLGMQGETKAAGRLLARAAADLDRGDRSDDPAWAGFLGSAYLDARTGHTLLAGGDYANAVDAARRSLNMDGSYVRGKMFNLALLSLSLIKTGELDEACTIGHQALGLSGGLRSKRADEYLRRIAVELLPHRSNTGARKLLTAIGSQLSPLQQDRLQADDRGRSDDRT
jgi:tetratricopeptide (TPR) repeat protein